MNENFAEKYRGLYTESFAADAVSEPVNPGVRALISCCEYYDAALKQAITRGEKWVYTNSNEYAPQQTTFDEMVASGKHGANCAMLSNWAFMDMGLMPGGARFWGGRDCTFVRYEQVREYIDAACDVTRYPDSVPFAELFAAGEVKAGDIFLAKGHTFVYRGDRSFFASGFDCRWHEDLSVPTEDRRHGVFDSFVIPMEDSSDRNSRVFFRIRLRDDYVPAFYRDREGRLTPAEISGR